MNLLRWILWGPKPDKKELDRALQSAPKDEPLADRARRISKKLGGR